MTQTPHDEDANVFGRQSAPPSGYDHSSVAFSPGNTAFPLADDNFIFLQFGGGHRYEDPAVELTPSRLRSTLKATAWDTGVIKGASARCKEAQQPSTESQGSSTSLDAPQDDSAMTTNPMSLTVAPSAGSSHHPSPFTREGGSFTPMLNTGNSRHPSPFTGDISSHQPAPTPIQDMFYGPTRGQPAWAGQQGSDMFGILGAESFTDLIGDQDLDSAAFTQGFSGHVVPFELQRPSHMAQASLAPLPSTSINPPAPDARIPTLGLHQASLAPPPSTNIIPPMPDTRIPTPGPSQRLDLSHYSPATISSEWFPEESLTSHSEELPVVSHRSAETNATLDAGFAAVDQALLELSRTTGMPMHQVINLFMKSRGRTASSINYWNLYSNYFKDNTKQELGRLGQNLMVGEHTPSRFYIWTH